MRHRRPLSYTDRRGIGSWAGLESAVYVCDPPRPGARLVELNAATMLERALVTHRAERATRTTDYFLPVPTPSMR